MQKIIFTLLLSILFIPKIFADTGTSFINLKIDNDLFYSSLSSLSSSQIDIIYSNIYSTYILPNLNETSHKYYSVMLTNGFDYTQNNLEFTIVFYSSSLLSSWYNFNDMTAYYDSTNNTNGYSLQQKCTYNEQIGYIIKYNITNSTYTDTWLSNGAVVRSFYSANPVSHILPLLTTFYYRHNFTEIMFNNTKNILSMHDYTYYAGTTNSGTFIRKFGENTLGFWSFSDSYADLNYLGYIQSPYDRSFDFLLPFVNNSPIITISTTSPYNFDLNNGINFTPPSATAYDLEDGDISDSITVSSTVVPTVIGDYTLTYSVCDSGNVCSSSVLNVHILNSYWIPDKNVDVSDISDIDTSSVFDNFNISALIAPVGLTFTIISDFWNSMNDKIKLLFSLSLIITLFIFVRGLGK